MLPYAASAVLLALVMLLLMKVRPDVRADGPMNVEQTLPPV